MHARETLVRKYVFDITTIRNDIFKITLDSFLLSLSLSINYLIYVYVYMCTICIYCFIPL